MCPYPTVKDMPNRKQRKALRRTIFEANKVEARVARKARREVQKVSK